MAQKAPGRVIGSYDSLLQTRAPSNGVIDVRGAPAGGNFKVTLDLAVARAFLEDHPEEAASVLEQWSPSDGARVLARVPAPSAASVLERVTSVPASSLLAALEDKVAAAIVEHLSIDVAARYLRRLVARRDAILTHVSETKQQALRSMLRYPERSAGALMDPEVLALAEDLTVREAVERVRASADHARYNVYVTDRSDVLVGAFNLRELLLAKPTDRITTIAHEDVMRLPADADRSRIIGHPGWRRVHALPVVDASGIYLGAIRYSTLRRLQEELLNHPEEQSGTTQALGEVFWMGLGGMLDLLAGPTRK